MFSAFAHRKVAAVAIIRTFRSYLIAFWQASFILKLFECRDGFMTNASTDSECRRGPGSKGVLEHTSDKSSFPSRSLALRRPGRRMPSVCEDLNGYALEMQQVWREKAARFRSPLSATRSARGIYGHRHRHVPRIFARSAVDVKGGSGSLEFGRFHASVGRLGAG